MELMIFAPTQRRWDQIARLMGTSSVLSNDQYWEQFSVQASDLDHLVNYLVESERPHTLDELAWELTRYRYEQMTSLMEETLSQGRVYRPGESYQVGEAVILAHMGNAKGEVVSVRPGRNPEYEPFSVMRLQLGAGGEREFAAQLSKEHPLDTMSYLADDEMSAEDVYAASGDEIRAELLDVLETNAQFVSVGPMWFVRALLVEVSPGQVNIAEAVLDMEGGGPVRTDVLMTEIDLPDEISTSLQRFSLEYALLRDHRFDEVGPAGYALWHLRSHEPKAVLETPKLLQFMPVPYSRQALDSVMQSLEAQIADEWSELPVTAADDAPVTIVLNYPHWRSGTLPLASHVANFFPTARIADRVRFTFVDDITGEEFPGWVVRSGRYVYGLESWFKEKQAFVGSYIDLARGEEPGYIRIGVRPIRSQRREWLRTVTVEGNNLVFEVTRVPAACEFDELAAVAVANPAAVDRWSRCWSALSAGWLDSACNGPCTR
jgi:hypothetical protein